MKHERIFIVVDLPAPLGPRKPTICPFSTLKETSWIAVTGPYCLVRWSTWIMILRSSERPRIPGAAAQYSTRRKMADGAAVKTRRYDEHAAVGLARSELNGART